MIRKMNSWPNEKEYIDPMGYYEFDYQSGSIRGYGYGIGCNVLLSKIQKCEVSIIENENFHGIGAEKLNLADTYAKYID